MRRLVAAAFAAAAGGAGLLAHAGRRRRGRGPLDIPQLERVEEAAGAGRADDVRAARAAPAAAASAAGPPEPAGHVGPELVGHAATPLLDGCTHAFLDLGANAGVQTRKLHQPKLYARSSFVPLFQKAGFYKDGAVRCAVGVEPAREY